MTVPIQLKERRFISLYVGRHGIIRLPVSSITELSAEGRLYKASVMLPARAASVTVRPHSFLVPLGPVTLQRVWSF